MSTTPHCPPKPAMPLAIWPVAQTCAQYQRTGRYVPECAEYPAKMLPSLARRIAEEFSASGDLVVDPMCGIGTTLVEAASIGRRATGVEYEPRWARTARDNLHHVLPSTQCKKTTVHIGDARKLPVVLRPLLGKVDLICTSPPYACNTGVIDKDAWRAGGQVCPKTSRDFGPDRANLGHARDRVYDEAMAEVYAGCFALLRPGGLLVVVTKHSRRSGRTLDLAGKTVSLCQAEGFSYLQHIVALHAAVRASALAARPSYWQLIQTRHELARGEPVHLVVHEDVGVFVKPDAKAVTRVR